MGVRIKGKRRPEKNKAGLQAIEKMKGLDLGQENLLLLEKLQKQLVKKAETSEDLEDSMVQGNATAKQLRRIQHREIEEGVGEESQGVEDALQQLLALAAQSEEREDGDWIMDNESSNEDDEDAASSSGEKSHLLLEKRLKDIVLENKNNEKIKREKKEYLERQKVEQNKKMEETIRKIRADQNKLLPQMSSLTSVDKTRKRKNHYSSDEETGEEEDEELEEESEFKSSKSHKRKISTVATSSKKKKKGGDEKGDSETKLMRYLQSLQQ